MTKCIVLLFALLLCVPAFANEVVGKVVGITDGDTLWLLVENEQIKVRLAEIDAPEKKQPFGERSRQSLAELCFGKQARILEHGHDRYGRTLGTVFVAGVDVNTEQVRRGMAWVYLRYSHSPELATVEKEARAGKRGLWTDTAPVPPWEWRKNPKQ